MSEDLCYIYTFAEIKIIVCDLRLSVCLFGFYFGFVQFYLGFQL
jgi:hypothetical protein